MWEQKGRGDKYAVLGTGSAQGSGTPTVFMHRLPIGRTLITIFFLVGLWLWWSTHPVVHPPGVLIAEPPIQIDIPPRSLGERNGFQLTAFARYALRARVLGTKRYYGGPQTPLVPVDVAIGWARLSDQSVLDAMKFSMGNRFFFYEWQTAPPIPQDEIIRSAANNHVISGSDAVASAIGHLKRGQIVEMQGWLVDALGPEGFKWPSSRRRDDTGNGACELFYVEKLVAWDTVPMEPLQVLK